MAPPRSPGQAVASSSMGPPLPSQPSALDPPLPINHKLTEPIAAFYKLQFSDEADGFAYYMQTLDVTIGRKVIPPPSRTPPPTIAKPPIEEPAAASSVPAGEVVVKDGDEKMDTTLAQQSPVKVEDNTEPTPPTLAHGPTPMDVDPPTKPSPLPSPPATATALAVPISTPVEMDIDAAPPLPLEAIISHPDDDNDVPPTPVQLPPPEVEEEKVLPVEVTQVEVDLGALKSVSRLHARIGYSYTLSQFYLEVLGRNGAWVDDVFVMKGSRVGLGPRTKIQISTRIFHFVLPPSSIPNYPIPFSSAASSSTSLYSHHPSYSIPPQASLLPLDESQKPATFNAFSNRDAWEDERMGLFGIGKGMGPNGGYGYKRKKRRRHQHQHQHEEGGSSCEECGRSSDQGRASGSSFGDSADWGSSQYSDSSEEAEGSGSGEEASGSSGSGEEESEDGAAGQQDPAAGKAGRRIALKIINGNGKGRKGKAKAEPTRIIKLKVRLPIPKPAEPEEEEEESEDEEDDEEDEDGDDEDEDDAGMRSVEPEIPPSSWKLDNTPRTAALAAARRAAMKTPQAGKKAGKGKRAAVAEEQAESDLSPPAPSPTKARGKMAGKGAKSVKSVKAPSVAEVSAAESSSTMDKVALTKAEKEKAKEEKAAAKAAQAEQRRLEKLVQKEAARIEKQRQKQEALDKLKTIKPEASPIISPTPPMQTPPIPGPSQQAAMPVFAPPPFPVEAKPLMPPPPAVAPMQQVSYANLPPALAAAMAAMPANASSSNMPTKNLTAALQSGGSAPMEIDPIPLISGHTPVSVPIPPTGQPRPPPGPILGLDGLPFIGPEPIKPLLTYAAIIYRALSNVARGRGTLGGVCDWVAGEWEWFRLNPEAGWQNSIRHNLSLNKAFLKVPRIDTDDPEQKGSVWILDPVHAPEFIAKERRNQEMKDAKAKRDSERYTTTRNDQKPRKTPKPKEPVKPPPVPHNVPKPGPGGPLPGHAKPLNPVAAGQTFPIIVAPIPAHLRDSAYNPQYPSLSAPPLVVDKGTIILNPAIFSHLTAEHLAHLQSLGTQHCLQILHAYVVQHMKDKMARAPATAKANPALANGKAPTDARPPAPVGQRPGVPAPAVARPTAPMPPRPAPPPSATPGAAPGVASTTAPAAATGSAPASAPAAAHAATAVPHAPGPLAPARVATPSVTPSAAAGSSNGNVVRPKAPLPPGSKPPLPAETLRVISQLAAATGAGGNGTITPGASALLRYLQQVGTSADMAVAAQILATGVIPPSAIPAHAQARPLAPPQVVRPGAANPARPASGIGGGTPYVARPGGAGVLQPNRLAPGVGPVRTSPSIASARVVPSAMTPRVSPGIPPARPINGIIPPVRPMGVIPPTRVTPAAGPSKIPPGVAPPRVGGSPAIASPGKAIPGPAAPRPAGVPGVLSPAVGPPRITPIPATSSGVKPAPVRPPMPAATPVARPMGFIPPVAPPVAPPKPVPAAMVSPAPLAPATVLGKRALEGGEEGEAGKKQKV